MTRVSLVVIFLLCALQLGMFPGLQEQLWYKHQQNDLSLKYMDGRSSYFHLYNLPRTTFKVERNLYLMIKILLLRLILEAPSPLHLQRPTSTLVMPYPLFSSFIQEEMENAWCKDSGLVEDIIIQRNYANGRIKTS